MSKAFTKETDDGDELSSTGTTGADLVLGYFVSDGLALRASPFFTKTTSDSGRGGDEDEESSLGLSFGGDRVWSLAGDVHAYAGGRLRWSQGSRTVGGSDFETDTRTVSIGPVAVPRRATELATVGGRDAPFPLQKTRDFH